MSDSGGHRWGAMATIAAAFITAVSAIVVTLINRSTPQPTPASPSSTPVPAPPTTSPDATTTAPPDTQPEGEPLPDLPAGEPSAVIQPAVIAEGEPFTVVGGGFPPGVQITLAFDGYFFAHAVADSKGRFYHEGSLDPLFCGSAPWSEFLATGSGVEVRVEVSLCQ